MNFVLIFCNSTASRLIYAYSHYNMCAGGGCMYQISNEKFGLFVTELRKKKNLTQKDLAEKLYVSDKTVDRKSTRLNSSHNRESRMPSSA